MKDIDFDELDQAVKSLMSGVPKAEPAKHDDIKLLAAASTAPKDGPEQSPAVLAETAPVHKNDTPFMEKRPTPVPPAASSALVPLSVRRGRFMDVVRPTAPEARKPVPSRAVSRRAAALEPSAVFTRSADHSSGDVTSASGQTPAQLGTSRSTDWPDPLAAVDFNRTAEAVMDKAPLSSPFLPDAKVEKRPLGKLSDADSIYEPSRAPVLGALAASDVAAGEASGDTAVPPPQPLPVELGQEVMAIEADTSGLSAPEFEPAEEVKTQPVRPASPIPVTSRPVATSIPQQYKVHPKAADPSPGAIYDTAAYHQPLEYPAKKKPGWLLVIAIMLILLLGAAGGAAVYFFGLV